MPLPSPALERFFGPQVAAWNELELIDASGASLRIDRLVELVRASLISEHAPGRYQSHDLLRSYATELARRTDTDEDRRSALARTLGHYLHSADAASVLLGPQLIDPPDLPAPPGGTAPEEPPDHDRAYYRAERVAFCRSLQFESPFPPFR